MRRHNPLAFAIVAAAVFSLLGSPLPPRKAAVPLLGGETSWRLNDWRQVTDGVRGGASTANLKGATDVGVEFKGRLDSTKLGDAFAGVSLKETALPKRLSLFGGLCVNVADCDGLEYSLELKQRGSPAGATHRFNFRPESGSSVEMPFRDFVPMLRGKAAPQPHPPLKLERVQDLTIRTDSVSGQRDGPFSLTIRSLVGMLPRPEWEEVRPPPRATRWTCGACGTMNFEMSASCQRCGSSREVGGGKSSDESLDQLFVRAHEAKINSIAEEAIDEDDRKKRRALEVEVRRLRNDETYRKALEKVKAAEKEAASKSNDLKWECSGCGAKNFPDAVDCHKCGAARA
mmetsp:Transcript_111105/g.313451  ORF Transcript_111105/g.313451 Transcript_111105/m.313451 type:complete len:344 (-) Transcript_111105:97-1128(-)|eukprot:CAMPEP_0117515122 /NCGR_PEP_ID=MMETSP0784-20121206/30418_1 /TAXON_ID=39447 /ORGANISM="" /LENGTH=343 /DNA_ID=CAMNT_0005310931 /DNA_START=63 /DNA_END=1094 /DNA_ORIENTATION=+